MMVLMPNENQTYLEFAQTLARKAGAIMREHLQVGIDQVAKADGSPVTIADTKINQLVIDAVQETYPTHTIVSEEAKDIRKTSEYAWICDPIDGTVPFTFGMPISLFSLALTKDGVPIVGVLYDPYEDRMYHAVQGGGAFLNDQPIHVNTQEKLSGTMAGLPGTSERNFDSANFRKEVMELGVRTLTLVCITAECVLVANGQFASTVFGGTSPWDIAAVKIIVEEAGGKVTNILGDEQRYDQPIKGALITNGLVHEEFAALIKPYIY